MKSVVLVTGAGTGIGKLTAEALAEAGHAVYASMRDLDGRNEQRAGEMRAWPGPGMPISARSNSTSCRNLRTLQSQRSSASRVVSTSSCRMPAIWSSARPKPSRRRKSPGFSIPMSLVHSGSTGQPCRSCGPAESGLMLWISSTTTKGGLSSLHGSLCCSKGGDGFARHYLVLRTRALRHRDLDSSSGAFTREHRISRRRQTRRRRARRGL